MPDTTPDDQSEVIAFLGDGASYGTPGAAVERIATHASFVFLTGDRAFKLKRAVKYSYLDYSTLARREACCRAELALNRRTAPRLYLGLRAVTRTPRGGLAFDDRGEVVEWVVEMRRFDQDSLFDRLAETHRLTPRLMRDLADEIAAFHRDAEAAPQHGGAAALASTIAINDENLRLAAPPLDPAAIERLRSLSLARLAQVTPLLEARRESGKVRRCHGDLHLRNVCLDEGRPTVFDGIEFNDDFACIDVLYDLAFLLMDLGHRRLDALASLVLNRYLDRTGDGGGLAALPLFLSLRAAVRAHVLGTLARSGAGAAEARAALASAASYLALALALLEPAPPRLVAIGGLSGTGKSTVAQALAPRFRPFPGARLLRSDTARKRLMRVAPETRLPPESYSLEAARRVYGALYEEAAAALAAGYSVIVDATFLRADERDAIAAVAKTQGVPFAGFWLEAPPVVLAARVTARQGDASDADRAVLERQLAMDPGALDWMRIDASAESSAIIAAAKRALGLGDAG